MDKLGRNDPCPCGSGKKMKKCCGAAKEPKKLNAQILSSGSASRVSSLFKSSFTPKDEDSHNHPM